MGITTILILGFIFGLAATILSFIYIIPDKKRGGLNPFFRFLHDLFNFKFLIVEKILQFSYVLATSVTLIAGVFMLFWFEESWTYNSMANSFYGGGGYEPQMVWRGYIGLLVILFGPIFIRLAYELLMMAIIAVKNLVQINNKIKNQNENTAPAPDAPVFTSEIPVAPKESKPDQE